MTPSSTVRSIQTRPALLFLVAIVLPCAVLVLLTLRMLVQDRELADKRMADERRRLTSEVRALLLGRVERLRAGAADSRNTVESAIAFVGHIQSGQLILPWQEGEAASAAASALSEPQFRDRIRPGEELEFGSQNFEAAAAAYERAAQSATKPVQRASANLLAARAFVKARRRSDVDRLTARVLQMSPDVVDDQGIPLALYAARMAADLTGAQAAESTAIRDSLVRVLASPAIGPEAIYMARDVANLAKAPEPITSRIDARARDAEQALKLRSELPTLGVSVSTLAEPIWVTFGPLDNAWLVNVSSPSDGRSVVTALRAAPLLADVLRGVTVSTERAGDSLAPNFPGLAVTLSSETLATLAPDSRLRTSFYIAALALVVSIALSGAYLFWRDVRREIRVAELRSQFVSSVSHELKTPLTAIRMFAETLVMGRSSRPEIQREYLETIVNESERLTRLLNNVLDFSKIESGQKTYRLERHSLAAVVRAAVKAMHYPLAQQGFDLHVAIDEHVPVVAADVDAIEQAILNLVSNAMKYSGESRIIELSLSRDGAQAVIAVTDRGLGIALEEQSRIFDKFYRVRDVATERIAGTGLGLTLVDHVVRGHNGRVTVRSAPGEGSTFAIHLPLLEADSRDTEALEVLA